MIDLEDFRRRVNDPERVSPGPLLDNVKVLFAEHDRLCDLLELRTKVMQDINEKLVETLTRAEEAEGERDELLRLVSIVRTTLLAIAAADPSKAAERALVAAEALAPVAETSTATGNPAPSSIAPAAPSAREDNVPGPGGSLSSTQSAERKALREIRDTSECRCALTPQQACPRCIAVDIVGEGAPTR